MSATKGSHMLRSLVIVPIMLAGGMAVVSFAQDAASDAAIRAIVAEQAVAWNAGDGQAYARHLAPDASFTNIFGMVMYGASAFAQSGDTPHHPRTSAKHALESLSGHAGPPQAGTATGASVSTA